MPQSLMMFGSGYAISSSLLSLILQRLILHMLRFRSLKEKIICGKRASQKISQEELLPVTQQCSLSRLNLSLNQALQHRIANITQESYKIEYRAQKVPQEQHQQAETFRKIIDLMQEINELQQRASKGFAAREDRSEMRRKLDCVKQLIASIEDDSQRSLIDFYNEQCPEGSPDSFHSHESGETYQQATDREAYEFTDYKAREHTESTEDLESNIEIKYRRLSPNKSSIYQELQDDKEEQIPQFSNFQQSPPSERSIVHLFSYEKDYCLDSPLSRISERQSEYCSPDSHPISSLPEESLEYKKIYYMLETTQKKTAQEVSQFILQPSLRQLTSIASVDERQRSRSHEQLEEMIALLENKYKRKVQLGADSIISSFNAAVSQKSIRLRSKKSG